MKKHHWNGSLITATRQAPSSSAANGLFNLVSQQVFKSASKWPAALSQGLNYSYWNTGTTSNPNNQSGFEAFFSGTPAGTGQHYYIINWDHQNSRGPKPSYLPDGSFAWQVEGFIYIVVAGTYFFGTGSDDGNQLTVDGTIVTSHYGGRGVSGTVTNPSDTGSITLSAGYHAFRYRMQEGGGGDAGYVCWKPPGETSYAAVPASVFFKSTAATTTSSGLFLNLDAGNTDSYSGSGTTWYDLTSNSNDGTLTNMDATNHSSSGGGYFTFDGTNEYVDISGSTTVTAASFVVWLRLDGNQDDYAGILFSRSTNVTGLNFYGTTERIGYTWNNASNTYDWNSGLTIPTQEWCMIALTVTSSSATAYLFRSSGVSSSTNTVSHSSTTIDSLELGRDSQNNSRLYDGRIGVAQVYNRALSLSELEENYGAVVGRWYRGIVTTNLILHLDAGDSNSYSGSGTTWTDLSSNNNDVTLVNGIGYSGANQGSLVFDGTNDYVREDTVLDTFTATSDTWSIECWFNTDVNPSSVKCMIGVNYNNGAENTFLLGVADYSGCKLNVYYRNSDISSSTTVTVGQWHHVVATHASEGLKVYLDGVQIVSNSNIVNRSLSDCAFLIGAELDSGSSFGNYFDGKISSTLVYSKALTATEVRQNYNVFKGRYG